MKNIRRMSNVLKIIFVIFLISLPTYTISYWLTNSYVFGHSHYFSIFLYEGPQLAPIWTLTATLKMYAFLLNMVPVVLYMFMLGNLVWLFHCFSQGDIMSPKILKLIKRITWTFLIAQLIRPAYTFMMSFIFSQANPPGSRYAYLGITLQDILMVFIGVILLLIYWVFSEYYKINQEQEFTV